MKKTTIVIIGLLIVIALLAGVVIGFMIMRQQDEAEPTATTVTSRLIPSSSSVTSRIPGYDTPLNSEETMDLLKEVVSIHGSDQWIDGLTMKNKYGCTGVIAPIGDDTETAPVGVILNFQKQDHYFLSNRQEDKIYTAGEYTVYSCDEEGKNINTNIKLRIKIVGFPPQNSLHTDIVDFYNISDLKNLGVIK